MIDSVFIKEQTDEKANVSEIQNNVCRTNTSLKLTKQVSPLLKAS